MWIIRNILKRTNNVERSAFIWNALSSMLLAGQSVIVLMLLTRTVGVEEAGIYTFAHSNASLLFFLGEFGVRRYQASDVTEVNSQNEYYGFRVLTCMAMIIALICFCGYSYMVNGYTLKKLIVVFFVGMYLVVQAFSDVYEANMQQKGRLDIAAKTAFIRIGVIICAYYVGILTTNNLAISSVLAFFCAGAAFLFTTFNVSRDFGSRIPVFSRKTIKRVFVATLPIFITLFLNNYIGNAPKYAIDAVLGDGFQAIYGFLFMPTYAIGIICNFIFNPIIVKYARLWTENHIQEFRKLICRQMIIIAAVTILGLLGAYILGIPFLSFIFKVDLAGYRLDLCVLIIGGGALAYTGFLTTIITIMRNQNKLLIGYAVVAIVTFVLSRVIIVKFGIMGAACLYTGIMTVLACVLFSFTVSTIKKKTSDK